MAYGIERENTTYLHGRDAKFYQDWLHDSMAGWFGTSHLSRHAFKGVESVIFGPYTKDTDPSVGEALSNIVEVLTPEEKAEFQKGLIGEVQAIIAADKTDRIVQLGSLFVLVETAYLTGMRDIIPLLPQLKTGFDLSKTEHKQLDDLVRDAQASLDVQIPQTQQRAPAP